MVAVVRDVDQKSTRVSYDIEDHTGEQQPGSFAAFIA
jgi:hypothetical protein